MMYTEVKKANSDPEITPLNNIMLMKFMSTVKVNAARYIGP